MFYPRFMGAVNFIISILETFQNFMPIAIITQIHKNVEEITLGSANN